LTDEKHEHILNEKKIKKKRNNQLTNRRVQSID